jgi:hypothetical protein
MRKSHELERNNNFFKQNSEIHNLADLRNSVHDFTDLE